MVAAVASYFSKINIILWGGEREDAIFSFPFKIYFFNKDFFENNEKSPRKSRAFRLASFFVKIHCRRIPEFRALRELDNDDATIPESRLWRDEGVHLQQQSPVLLDWALLLRRVDKKDATQIILLSANWNPLNPKPLYIFGRIQPFLLH